MYLLHISSSLPESCMIFFLIFAQLLSVFLWYFCFVIFLHFTISCLLEIVANTFKETIGNPTQCPKTQQCSARHNLILIDTEKFLHIFKKDFNIPTDADNVYTRLSIRFEIAGDPETCGRNGILQTFANDNKFTAIQLSYTCIYNMNIYLLLLISRTNTLF